MAGAFGGVTVATLIAKLEAQTAQFNTQISNAEKRLQGLETSSGRAGSAVSKMSGLMKTVGVAGALAVGKQLFTLGVQAEAWERRFTTVFGEAGDSVRVWADDLNERLGVSEERLKGMAAAVGDLLVPMGFARDKATDMSIEVLNLSGALSEWTGGTVAAADASNAIIRAILGEREALIPLGVKISELDVQSRLAAKGQDRLTGAALTAAKAQATLELITERSADAITAFNQGASGGVAAQNAMKAAMDHLMVTAGKLVVQLAPVVELIAQLVGFAADVITITVNLIGDFIDFFGLGGYGDMLLAQVKAMDGKRVVVSVGAEGREEWERLADVMGGIDPAKYAAVAAEIRKSFGEPLKKIPQEVIGAFDKMPAAIDLTLAELQAIFAEHLSAQTAWEKNINTLVALGLDSVAAEFAAAGPEYAALLQEALSDPLLAELNAMEADIDAFNSRVNLAEDLGAAFATAGMDWSLFADLRQQLGITTEKWLTYWAAASGVGVGNTGGSRASRGCD